MSDPLDKATSSAPATLGEGCVRRYDPQALSEDDGTDFPGAAELWQQLQQGADALAESRGEGATQPYPGCVASKGRRR